MGSWKPGHVIGLLAPMLVSLAATGCSMTAPHEPDVPAPDFRPKLVLSVDDQGINVAKGPRDDAAVTTNPPSVGGGTVVEVANTGSSEHRLRSGTALDSGRLMPGEHTIMVLTNDTTSDISLPITDANHQGVLVTLTVRPRG